MRALVISDSHGRDNYIERAVLRQYPIDRLIHLGDLESSEEYIQMIASCPTELVAGNCDYFSRLPKYKIVSFGRHQLFLTHGHLYDVRTGTERLVRAARQMGCDYALFGHTHVPCFKEEHGVTVINPGSIALPKQADHKSSYVVLETDEADDIRVHFIYQSL